METTTSVDYIQIAAFVFSCLYLGFFLFCSFQWRKELIELFFFATKLKRRDKSEE